MSDVVVYSDGELELNISVNDETVWLTQKQLGDLFGVEVHTVNYHIKNIFKQKELEKNATIRKIRIVQKEGKREVQTNKKFHDRFMIIDGREAYHIGASLKDAGKKIFALSKMTLDLKDILK